jgi:hypothetical protein
MLRFPRASTAAILVVSLLLGESSSGAATHWAAHGQSGSSAQGKALSPSAPSGVTSGCGSSNTTKVKVSWTTASHASGYTVYQSKTSGGYTNVATVTTTSWTSGSLTTGTYKFEVATSIGPKWLSSKSRATASRTITGSKKTCK